MKNIFVILVLIGMGYFIYSRYFGNAERNSNYSLATVATNPIPKDELLLLWKDVALQSCSNAPQMFEISSEKCRQGVETRYELCSTSAGAGAPMTISQVSSSKRIGKAFLNCVMPGIVCNGVEVRSEAEARAANCS